MSAPQWIWTDADGAGRNVFALFRNRITVVDGTEDARLHLFGDARWRLRVNGAIVAYGPGRFAPAHPMYDSIDLAAWLRTGSNDLLVEVWSPGSSTFQTMPESSGGFIAWGAVAGHDLATPGSWQAHAACAWDGDAPAYSFAQGPVEILDPTLLPDDADGWAEPVLRAHGPWGPLEPRSLPPLAQTIRPVERLLLAAPLTDDEIRVGVRRRRLAGGEGEQRFPYALTIASPRDQAVEAGLFWGPHWLNGAELATTDDGLRGNRQNAVLHLRKGWNLLYGEPAMLTEIWSQYIALPAAAELTIGTLHAGRPQPHAALRAIRGAVPATAERAAALDLGWEEAAVDGMGGGNPAREMAWDRPGTPIASPALPLALAGGDRGWTITADLGGEFLGHIRVDVDAPADTVIDIASDERFRADGCLGLYATNPFVDAADRIVHPGGRATHELFHPRGGRYVQITIRPQRRGGVVLHDIALRSHQVAVPLEGAFACGDADLDWIWPVSHATLQACVEDAFLDCPWRERGTYLGDALVESATLAACTADPSIAKRSLRLWAQSQMPDGQLQDCAPSWHRRPLGDFSLIWIILLHQLWSRDGDLADARAHWDVVGRVLGSTRYRAGRGRLWDTTRDTSPFIDWGSGPDDRIGEANGCINAFRLQALACAATLARALAKVGEAARFEAEHAAVLEDFRRRLWLPGEGRFARREIDGHPDPAGPALHVNALALAFGLAPEDGAEVLADHCERHLADNHSIALRGGNQPGHLELYFLGYALDGLYRHGRAGAAEAVIRAHWGAMRSRGAWTMWECLRRGAEGAGSLCHAWSTAPARFLHERVLGVRQAAAGDPTRWTIAPDTSLDRAEGLVPTVLGPIRVAWRRRDGRIEIEASAPPGITLETAGADSLTPALAG